MKRPKVRYTIAGEHTKYIARCMEGEYHSQENPRAEKSVEILNGKETANGVCAYTTNSSNIRTYPDTHSQEIKDENYPNTYLGARSEVVESNQGMRTMDVDNHPDTILSGLQRFRNKYGYNWKDDT